jgi:hypothetical protein
MRDIGDLKEIERHVKFKRDIGKCKGRFRKICGRYRNIREETRRETQKIRGRYMDTFKSNLELIKFIFKSLTGLFKH